MERIEYVVLMDGVQVRGNFGWEVDAKDWAKLISKWNPGYHICVETRQPWQNNRSTYSYVGLGGTK